MNISFHKLLPFGIILGSVLLFVALFVWGIIPFQESIVAEANRVQADRTLQANQEMRLKELPQLQAQYDSIVQNESRVDTRVSHDQMVPFIERVERLAHDNGLEMVITNQDQSVTKKMPTTSNATTSDSGVSEGGGKAQSDTKKKKDETILGNLPLEKFMLLRFDVWGSYANVLQFLSQAEYLPYALDVVAVDMRHWQPSDMVRQGDTFFLRNTVDSQNGLVTSPDKPAEQHLVQGLFDIVVYTKD